MIDELKTQSEESRKMIDHEQHAALLMKPGIDPGQLAEKAAKQGLASLLGSE